MDRTEMHRCSHYLEYVLRLAGMDVTLSACTVMLM